MNFKDIKKRSEETIIKLGGKVNKNLPILKASNVRTIDELVARSAIVLATLQIYFKAPVGSIHEWISKNKLTKYLSHKEKLILKKTNDTLKEQDLIDLYWNIESLVAFMWSGNVIDSLDIDFPVPDTMASLSPNIKNDEGIEKFSTKMHLRSQEELFQKLDLYYRAHWYVRDAQLNGYDAPSFDLDSIMERRKALEWLLDSTLDWDNIELST